VGVWEKLLGLLVTELRPCCRKWWCCSTLKRNEFEGTGSFLKLHFVLHREALCAENLKMNHVMVTLTKSVDFIRASGRNHCESAALLEEVDSEYREMLVICHANIKCVCLQVYIETFL
jgi:hypothetical protein